MLLPGGILEGQPTRLSEADPVTPVELERFSIAVAIRLEVLSKLTFSETFFLILFFFQSFIFTYRSN